MSSSVPQQQQQQTRPPYPNATDPNSNSDSSYVPLSAYVGFDQITNQINKKFLKRGFHLNVMLVGESGLGKSTFVNTLFDANLLGSKGRKLPGEPIPKTTKIETVSHCLIENGVKLKLRIIDTPGYGDHIDNFNCWESILTYIKDQHGAYLKKELTALRERFIDDTRIHCCLYFISPTGHSLKPIDIVVLKKLVNIVNVIPVIAKSDSLTMEERNDFKQRIKRELEFHDIKLYPYSSIEDDEEDINLNTQIQDMIPFAIVGSTEKIQVDGIGEVRGRKNRCGIINIEDESHCEFVHIRNVLTRTHLQDLLETTQHKHYENFRREQIMAFSNSSKSPQNQPKDHHNNQKASKSSSNNNNNRMTTMNNTNNNRTQRG